MTERIVSEIIESNVFVVSNEKGCIIFDAGASLGKVKDIIGNKKVEAVFLTHGHYDHCYFLNDYLKEFGCNVFCSEFAKEYLENSDFNYSEGKFKIYDFSKFKFLKGNGKVRVGDFDVEFKQLGGHSKSDMLYRVGDEIFVGDVLIGRDMGRIDLYGGSKERMKESLQTLLKEDYVVMHSGHGKDNDKQTQDKVCNLWIKFLNR